MNRVFFDTNVLLYAYDEADPVKNKLAQQLLRKHWAAMDLRVSTQVLQEFFAVATRKFARPLTAAQASGVIAAYTVLDVYRPSAEDVLAAIEIHSQHQVSIWDSMIIIAAQQSGASRLYSEDLQHGQRFGKLQIINPFS